MAANAGDPGYAAAQRFRAFAYAGTPLARPVLGTPETIAAVSRDEVVAYWKERYVPANMLLVVSMGRFRGWMMSTATIFGAAAGVERVWPVAALSIRTPSGYDVRTQTDCRH